MVIPCVLEEMSSSGKKRIATKQKRTSVEIEQSADSSDSRLSGASDEGRRDTSSSIGYVFSVTASWISTATLFPAELHSDNLAELPSVSGLPAPIAHLVRQKIKSWFPVQKAVLPDLLKDISHVPLLRPRDIAVSAPTGSGKTLCYVLPILTQVGPRPNGCLQALVIVPVQTLVKQIEKEFATYNGCGAVVTALSGATDFSKEQRHLAPDGVCTSNVIISTPGRLMDHLTDTSSGINLSSLRFLVVDEADRMGPMVRQEWLETVERRSGCLARCANLADIVASRWAPRKILLSATLSKDIEELHVWNLHQPRFFRASASANNEVDTKIQSLNHVSGPLSLPSSIRHTVLVVEQKYHPLVLYLKIIEHNWEKVLVFTNENKRFRDASVRLAILISRLARSSFKVENLTGDLFGNRRAKVLNRFKNGTVISHDLFIHVNLVFQRKIFIKNVLKKNGLWFNAQEVVLETHELEPHLARYKKALAHLKKALIANKTIDSSDDQALSYEYAECLAAQAFLRIAHLSYFVKQRPNAEFISPTGKIPLLRIRRTLIPEFNGIVDFVAKKGIKLCSHLNDAQIAEMRAHMSIMDVLLRKVEMYVMWKHDDTYSKLTRYRYGSVYKWPLNRILPALKRREILLKLQDNGWADKSTEEVLEQYDRALRALSSQLGSKPYLFGNQPTEADALLFGHLFTIITMTLPCMDLKNAILSYTNLQDFVTRVENEYFKT
ncbi:unnamed protein product [Angiostrongylus costaricensis]|uniref:Helicase ATP-binding domain-containing protein n=1 Tax=Angiostrongylus costaricensis TaxID=334426 RepID=A0A158PD57_ANGCS|nr:unnamed protein product [Angiostrongylus costaricensis]